MVTRMVGVETCGETALHQSHKSDTFIFADFYCSKKKDV